MASHWSSIFYEYQDPKIVSAYWNLFGYPLYPDDIPIKKSLLVVDQQEENLRCFSLISSNKQKQFGQIQATECHAKRHIIIII